MKTEKYDCIIMGGGIGGLLTANILASEKKRVLLLEKNSFTGGFYSRFHLHQHPVDYAVSYFLGLEESGLLKNFFQQIGIKTQFERVNTPDLYIFPDFNFLLPSNVIELKRILDRMFPQERAGISSFISAIKNLYIEHSKSSFLYLNPIYAKNINDKYFDYLDSLFLDEKIKAILSARAFGSDVGMITMLTYLRKILQGGIFQEINNKSLPDLLENKFLQNDGTILYNHTVDSVIVEDKHVCKVIANGKEFQADHYISACDMKKMFCQKINVVPTSTKKTLLSQQTSLSSISLFLIVKQIPFLLLAHKVTRAYIYNDYDLRKLYKDKEKGILDGINGIKINVPNILDEKFGNKESYTLRIEIDIAYSLKKELDRDQIKNEVINVLHFKLGLTSEDILSSVLLLPNDFEELCYTTNGAASGWNPESYWNTSLFEDYVADNFYQTGCWDKFGSGIYSILLSAKRVARKIYGIK